MRRDYDDDDFLVSLIVDRRKQLSHLGDRLILTYRYLGPREVLRRVVTFPLRFTPLADRPPRGARRELHRIERWYATHGRPVSIVIPSYRDAVELSDLVRSIRRTTRADMVEIVVADDASGPEHLRRIRAIEGITVVAGEENLGFAVNANRAIRATDPSRDVVLLNSDMKARPHWLAAMQYASRQDAEVGIVSGKLVYPSGRIQFGGTIRNPVVRQCFDHRHRGRPAHWGPANVAGESLAVCGACMYVRRELIDQIGLLDERYPMLYEDVDWCLRTWQAGFSVTYFPLATLEHVECSTRGTQIGDRERTARERFWARWGTFLDVRPVHAAHGLLRVVYVSASSEDDDDDVIEHLNALRDRGHDVALYTLGSGPTSDEVRAPVRTFADRRALIAALAPLDAIKVATATASASAVWRATVLKGLPVYWVRDVSERPPDTTLASFGAEFHYMAGSSLIVDRLSAHGVQAALVSADSLEAFLEDVATPRPTAMTADPSPKLRRTAR